MHHTTLFNNRYHRYSIWTVILFEMKSPPEEFPGCGNLVIIVKSYMTWLLRYIVIRRIKKTQYDYNKYVQLIYRGQFKLNQESPEKYKKLSNSYSFVR